jgi:hypothetical protein
LLVVEASEYFVSPVGNGLGSSIHDPMSIYKFYSTNFEAGDIISFISDSGPLNAQLKIDGSKFFGTQENPILIRGINGVATVDVSGSCCQATAAILAHGVNHLKVEDFAVIGNGGESAVFILNSGSADDGFTVELKNVSVLSNSGPMQVDHDGFDISFNSEVVLYSPSTSGTRPENFDDGSHQSITAHSDSQVVVYDAYLTDTNYWAVVVDNSTITFAGGVFRNSHVGSFAIGSNGSEKAFIRVQDSPEHPSRIEIKDAFSPKSKSTLSSKAFIELDGGELLIQNADNPISDLIQTSNRGSVIIKNMSLFEIDSTSFRYLGMGGSHLTIMDSNLLLRDSADYFFKLQDGAAISMARNVIHSTHDDIVIFSRFAGNESIELIANQFQSDWSANLIRLESSFVSTVKVNQNSFDGGKLEISFNSSLTESQIYNNNFVNAHLQVNDFAGQAASHNNFFNASSFGNFPMFFDSAFAPASLISKGIPWWEDDEHPLGIDGQIYGVQPNIGPLADKARLNLEAESSEFTGAFRINYSSEASAGAYLEVPEGAGNGSYSNPQSNVSWINFKFFVQEAGLYRVVGDAKAPHSGSNSFWVHVLDDNIIVLWAPIIADAFIRQNVIDRAKNIPLEVYAAQGEKNIKLYLREDATSIDSLRLIKVEDFDSDGVSNEFDDCPYDSGNSHDTDGDGLCDLTDPFPNDPNNNGVVRLEAEMATLFGQFEKFQDTRASQGQYIGVLDGRGNGDKPQKSLDYALLDFNITKAGYYQFRGSARGNDSAGNSFWIQIDSDPNFLLWDIPISTDFVGADIAARAESVVFRHYFEVGPHSIKIALREDGAFLDWLEISE